MLKRVLVAVVCIPLLLVIFFVLPPIATPILFALLSAIAVHEVLWSTGFVKNAWLSGLSIALAGLIPFWAYAGQPSLPALVALFLYFTLVSIIAISSQYKVTVEKMGGAFLFAVLIPYFLSAFVRLRVMPSGQFLILTPLIAAFLSDAFALFAGMLFGKHKLAPKLSPKKTVEGAIGGLVGAVVGMVVYGIVMAVACKFVVSYPRLILYGLLGSVISQLGDLTFSYIKRQYQLKDFGYIFPGHGGVLDRFDSVIFCAPLLEILWEVLPAVWPAI